MELHNRFRDEAEKRLKVADHMLTVTYPLVKDPKLLLAILENIYLGISHTLSYVLHYLRKDKKVPSFLENFDSKYRVFVEKVVPYNNIDKVYVDYLTRMRDLLIAHRKSTMEFPRNDRFVICSEEYDVESFNAEDIKDYLKLARRFFADVKIIITRNEILERDN